MGWVMLSARKLFLTQKVNDLEFKQTRLMQQLHDLHKYSSCIADGQLDYSEMAGMPQCTLPYAFQYASAGQTYAYGMAGQQAEFLHAQWIAQLEQSGQNVTQEQFEQGKQYLFQQALQSQLAEVRKAEEARVKVIEDDIQQQLEQVKTQISAARQEMQATGEGIDADIKNSAPKYA